jgi:hypothetical protein
MTRGAKTVAGLQATYYLATGLWPVLHLESFEAVTGGKTDDWLVQSFGLLVIVIALALARGLFRSEERATLWLGLTAAIGLVVTDVLAAQHVSAVYATDAVIEGAFAIGWLYVRSRLQRPEVRSAPPDATG